MHIDIPPMDVAGGMTRLRYMRCFNSGNTAGIVELFDPHYGKISMGGTVWTGLDQINALYQDLFCLYVSQGYRAKLELLPDPPGSETNGVFIERCKGAVRVYEQILAPINGMIVKADVMISKHTFISKTIFTHQPKLDAHNQIYLPILHLIVSDSVSTRTLCIARLRFHASI